VFENNKLAENSKEIERFIR